MGYHFCKDCVYSETIKAKEVIVKGHRYISSKCSQSEGGALWSPQDYGRIKHTCPAFVPIQNVMEVEHVERTDESD